MMSTSMPDLPPEMITEIFASMDSFATASALSKTSHQFHSIFVRGLESITVGILGRSVECFEQARELVDAQAITTTMEYHPDRAAALYTERTTRFLINSEEASEAADHFNIAAPMQMSFKSPCCRSMTASENKTFLRAYYRAMTIASPARQYVWNILDWRVLDVFQVSDALRFLVDYSDRKATIFAYPDQLYLLPDFHDSPTEKAASEINALCGDLMDLQANEPLLASYYISKVKYPFLGDPAYKNAVGNERGARLSQLYPSLSKEIKNRLPYLL